MNRQQIDIDLINKAKAGYQEAYTALFEYYYLSIFKSIYCILKDYQDAEDQTMITFEKAFEKLDTYYPLYLFSTWLSRIAQRTAFDFIKYKKIRMFSDVELAHVITVKNIETPEKIFIQKEEVRQLKNTINSLPQIRKEIVVLRMMGLKCREVSETLGITTNAVVGQLRYIKQAI